jgi:hypothetical protein
MTRTSRTTFRCSKKPSETDARNAPSRCIRTNRVRVVARWHETTRVYRGARRNRVGVRGVALTLRLLSHSAWPAITATCLGT